MHDNFELPDVVELQNKYIIFNEDCVSFMQWEDAGAKLGTFKMYHQGNNQYFEKSSPCHREKYPGPLHTRLSPSEYFSLQNSDALEY